jgi:hypothetical protein
VIVLAWGCQINAQFGSLFALILMLKVIYAAAIALVVGLVASTT